MKQVLGRQGEVDFSLAPRLQTIWGFREATVFFLEGVSVTVFVGFMFLGNIPGMIVGVLLLIGAVVLLLSHLGHPFRAWLAVRNFRRSWVSRGTCVIGAFNGLGIVYIAAPMLQIDLGASLTSALGLLLIVAGIFILLYPGFAMAASPAIPFWSSGMLPVLSLANGLSSGGMVLLLFYITLMGTLDTMIGPIDLVWLQQSVLGALAVMTFVHMVSMSNAGAAAGLSANYLMTQEPVLFWVLAIGAGQVLPIAAIVLTLTLDVAPVGMLWVAVAGRLAGDVSGRYAILKGGIYEAVLQPNYRKL